MHKIEGEGAIKLGSEIWGNTCIGHVFRDIHKLQNYIIKTNEMVPVVWYEIPYKMDK